MERFGKDREIKGLPYSVIGHSATPLPMLSVTFTAQGILALAKKIKKGDLVRYTAWSDVNEECESRKHYSEWTLIPQNKGYKTKG